MVNGISVRVSTLGEALKRRSSDVKYQLNHHIPDVVVKKNGAFKYALMGIALVG